MESIVADASTKSVEEIKQKPPPEQVNEEQDREYSCKYCERKFTNKQALGGHQNAHKVNRAVEKRTRGHAAHGVHQQMSFAYPGLMNPDPFLGYYNRSHEFMTRSIINAPHSFQPPLQHGIHVRYGARPGLRVVPDLYGPPRPPLGYNNGYFNWPAPYYAMPSHAPNCQYITPRANGGHVCAQLPFPGPHPNLGVGPGHRINGLAHIINQVNGASNIINQVDDSGLDLSLKL